MSRSAAIVALGAVACGPATTAVPAAPRVVTAQGHVARASHPKAPAAVASDDSTAPVIAIDVSVALVAGGWHGTDDDRWQYDLDIQTDATFTQIVHQSAEGQECQQTGTVTAGAAEILRTFRDNECNHDYDGKTVHDRVISLDDAHMVLQMESDYLIRYDRTP